jgi:hypothetical protein
MVELVLELGTYGSPDKARSLLDGTHFVNVCVTLADGRKVYARANIHPEPRGELVSVAIAVEEAVSCGVGRALLAGEDDNALRKLAAQALSIECEKPTHRALFDAPVTLSA